MAERIVLDWQKSSLSLLLGKDIPFFTPFFETSLTKIETVLGITGKQDKVLFSVLDSPEDQLAPRAGGTAFPRNQSKKNGLTLSPILIFLTLPSSVSIWDNLVRKELNRALAHEMHHAKREDLCGYGGSLGQTFVSEGLACCFEEEFENIPHWSRHLIADENYLHAFQKYAQRMVWHLKKPEKKWEYDLRLLGRKDHPDYPAYCGYTLGYLVCSEWLRIHGLKASQQIGTKAHEIWNWWNKDRHLSIKEIAEQKAIRSTAPIL